VLLLHAPVLLLAAGTLLLVLVGTACQRSVASVTVVVAVITLIFVTALVSVMAAILSLHEQVYSLCREMSTGQLKLLLGQQHPLPYRTLPADK
jgi:hypothetical protein